MLWLDLSTGRIDQLLLVSGDPVPDMDRFFTSVTVGKYSILGNLLAYPTQSPAAFYNSRRTDLRRQENKPNTFRELSCGYIPGSVVVRKFGFESGSLLVEARVRCTWRWRMYAVSACSLVFSFFWNSTRLFSFNYKDIEKNQPYMLHPVMPHKHNEMRLPNSVHTWHYHLAI